jgi:stage II sporulation SpoE-like protein
MDAGQGAQAGEPRVDTGFPALLEDSTDDLYENAPCGNLSTLLDGTIARVNATLLGWLGYTRDELVGRLRFSDRDDARYCTVVFGILTRTADGFTAVIASGGHPEPLLLRADGSAAFQPTRGRIVGAFGTSQYTDTTVVVGAGDTLVLYSDGLTEARTDSPDSDGGRYGTAALARFAGEFAPTTASGAVAALTGLLDAFGAGLDDDAAIMAISSPG